MHSRLAPGLIFLCGLALASAAHAGERLQLADDRGQSIAAALNVCFQLPAGRDCRRQLPGQALQPPAEFSSVEAEGEEHGPVSLARRDIPRLADGSLRLLVPRKAWLSVTVAAAPPQASSSPAAGRARRPLQPRQPRQPQPGHPAGERPDQPESAGSVSLYSPQSASFREPLLRAKLGGAGEAVRIPAGTFIVSVSLPPYAPNLQRLTARPAEHVHLLARGRPGWSLVARCTELAGGRPLAQAAVRLDATPGYGRPDVPLTRERSGGDGLVLIAGIEAPQAGLVAEHAGLLPGRAAGLLAAPGMFTFTEVRLARGGAIHATVSLHGRPLPRLACRVFALDPTATAPPHGQKEIWAGQGDARGACRSGPLAEGLYRLSVAMPDGRAQVSRWVELAAGQDAEEDVALAPTRLSGRVLRKDQPAPGYSVHAVLRAPAAPPGAQGGDADQASSGDDGHYEITLWAPGTYALLLKSPSGAPVSLLRQLTTDGGEERQMDFDLGTTTLRGAVVDGHGQPVAGAMVWVRAQNAGTRYVTDEAGGFEADLGAPGTASVNVVKTGFKPAGPVEVEVRDDQPTTVSLVLVADQAARALIVDAGGAPVAGALVVSVVSRPGDGPQLYATTRSADDGTFAVGTPPQQPTLAFISGPGCPLFAAQLPAPGAASAGGATDGGDAASAGDAGAGGGASPGGDAGDDGDASDGDAPAVVLHCPPLPAAVELTITDERGMPLRNAGFILRQQGVIVPRRTAPAICSSPGWRRATTTSSSPRSRRKRPSLRALRTASSPR